MTDTAVWSYCNPVRIVSAPLECLAQYVTGQHLLLVTTPGFVRRGVTDQICKSLFPRRVTIWDRVKPNPDILDIDKATVELCHLGVEEVIGLGGGSALDAAKALATRLSSVKGQTLQQVFRNKAKGEWSTRLPLIAIPTTSGTGSEVTPFATVWDHELHKKYSITGDFLIPDLAFLDASLTLTLDSQNTLYPALDALSHSLESLWNKNCTPISRAYAFQALNLLIIELPKILKGSLGLKSRQDLQSASLMAGMAISQTRTAIAHSISYPLTTHFNIPHGLACSFTLPTLLNVNKESLANNRNERMLLDELHEYLTYCSLGEHIKGFASKNKIFELRSEMITLGRSDNYCGEYAENIEMLLNQSLV